MNSENVSRINPSSVKMTHPLDLGPTPNLSLTSPSPEMGWAVTIVVKLKAYRLRNTDPIIRSIWILYFL